MVKWKKHKKFLVMLAAFTIIQLAVVALRWNKPLVWDSSVYVGMGKHIFSFGEIGLWESFRPPLLSLLIGAIWKIGFFFPSLARLIAVAISSVGATAFYKMVERDFGRVTAVYAATILISTSVYLRWGHYLLTGIPAAILVYASIHYAAREKIFRSGLIVSLAFLTRFPAALAAPVAGATLLLSIIPLENILEVEVTVKDLKELLKKGLMFGTSFSILPLIYFGLNEYHGSGFLAPILSGASVPMLNPDKYLYGLYFLKEAVFANPLLAMMPLGIYFVYKSGSRKFYGYSMGLFTFYIFFTFYPHKEARFMILFLPLLALFAAHGIREIDIRDRRILLEITKERLFVSILAIVVIFNAVNVINANTWETPTRNEFVSETSKLNGTVAGLNPAPVVHGDFRFMAVRPEHYENTTERVFRQADYFVMNSCAWYCTPSINSCEQKENELLQRLEEYNKTYEKSSNECRYAIYRLK